MKKILIVFVLLISGFLFSGCDGQKSATKQSLNVEKTGVLQTKSGDEYLLNTDEGIVNMNSTKINLDNYLKKKIKVKGQYSGSTLYVDEINETK